MNADEPPWEPPGPGQWYASAEHMPEPVTTLFSELFPPVAEGWARGPERYGLTPNLATFGESNRWLFYSPGASGPVDLDAMERKAADVLATERWRADLRHWFDELRPQVVAENRARVSVDPVGLDDPALAQHVDGAIGHFLDRAPEHFGQMTWQSAALGALFEAAATWGLDPHRLLPALAGAATASSSAEVLYDRIAAGLRAGGVGEIDDLDAVDRVGGDAAAALDELLVDVAWRAFHSDLATTTLAERPDAIVQGIRSALAGRRERCRPTGDALDALRAEVPEANRARFDDLADVARIAYGANEDNTVVLYSVPLGLARRGVLEVGRRLVDRGRLHAVDDALEARRAELQALLAGSGPSADDLAERTADRRRAAALQPPAVIGTPLPPTEPLVPPPSTRRLQAQLDAFEAVAWARHGDPERAVATVGTIAVEGPAVVATDPTDAALRLEPGDVLVAPTTTAPYNTIFPMAAAVAVEHGGLMSHATVLARELGIPAVIGVLGLLDRVRDGDLVRVDPMAGTITVLDRAT